MGGVMSRERPLQLDFLLGNKVFMVYLALGVLLLVAGLVKPFSVGLENLSSVLRWSSFLGLVAIGQTVVMIAGGIDISVGMIVYLTYNLGARMMGGSDAEIPFTVLFCLFLGGMIGLVNGVGVALARIPHIVMTLGTYTAIYGAVWIYTGGVTGGLVSPAFKAFGKLLIWKYVPVSTIIWLAVCLLFSFVMRRTTFGRKIYGVGSNITAVRFSGINVNLPLILSYVISGVLAAAAGLLFLGYLGMANMFFVDMYTMGSIAAAVIGGTAFFSGIGTIAGTIAGTIIMRFIFNVLVMFRVADAGRMIAEGLIILVIMALYNLTGRE